MERVWDQFLSEQDKAHLAASRRKRRYGYGDRAAVISIDNYRGVVGDERLPLMEAVEKWPGATGLAGWEALDHITVLFARARDAGVPIIHITGLREEDSGVPGWSSRRGGRGSTQGEDGSAEAAERRGRRYDIVDEAAPLPGEVVLRKTTPSAFLGTPLLMQLNNLGIDTLIVAGESVSGCVRATVVDGCSYRLNMIVVEECVYDRHEAPRAINLFDMDQKYADVVPLAEVLEYLAAVQAGVPFEAPEVAR
jgi:maleamate amidohydrolase